MNVSDALPFVGQYLTMAQTEAQQLPNEYTRGQLEGIQKVYSGIINELQHPGTGSPQLGDEDIPFSNPPVNPNTGQMIKTGEDWERPVPGVVETRSEDYDRRPDVQSLLMSLQETNTIGTNMMIGQLGAIKDLLEEIRDQNNEITYENPFGNDGQDNSPRGFPQQTIEEADAAIEQHERLHADPKIWDRSFGERMKGTAPDLATPKQWNDYHEMMKDSESEDFQQQPSFDESQSMAAHEGPAMEEYMDVDTGEMVRQRTIGAIRFDDEYEPPSSSNADNYQEWARRKEAEEAQERKSAEEWGNAYPGTRLRGPYVANDGGDQYGLEDLHPGG